MFAGVGGRGGLRIGYACVMCVGVGWWWVLGLGRCVVFAFVDTVTALSET